MNEPRFFERSELTTTLWAFRREFLMVGFYSLIINVLMLSPTLYMLQVFDRVLASQSELTLVALSLVALFLFGVMSFADWLRSSLLIRAGVRLDARLGTQVFNASFEAHLSNSGATPMRAFSDLLQIRQFFTGSGVFAFFDAPWTPIFMGVLFLLHPMLGVFGCVAALVQAALAWFGHRHTLQPSEAAGRAYSDANSYMQEKLRSAEVVESMGMVRNLRSRWYQMHQNYLVSNEAAQQLTHKVTAWSKFVQYSQQSLVLGVGALLVIDGQLTAGGMIAANVLMSRALAPIGMIVSSWRQFASMRMSFARLEKLLMDNPQRRAMSSGNPPRGSITLKNVVATAPRRPQPILQNIDLDVAAGTVVAILGPSGSGKSTLARVLVGIWPHIRGEVLLDGAAMSDWNRIELGPHIGYLPQDIEIFEGTIAGNIARFGALDSKKVIAAAKSAGLHEMILRLPKGYNTPVGEAGGVLSGGQRQRIGLARAVFGNPVLLVLDEPNSNLDDVGEDALLKTVQELKSKGSTVFLITHRTGILAAADRILVLQDGKIVVDSPRDKIILETQPHEAAV
jgi:ATP-binding cassette subfamily C exporter for protease/lipase